MCTDCGCQEANRTSLQKMGLPSPAPTIELHQKILAKNDHIAGHNREWLHQKNISCLNMMSSPGSGKTLLLEKTLEALQSELRLSILVGDQQTERDAERLKGKGAPVHQINTHSSCHLDANQIASQLDSFVTGEEDLLIIENVGNLVCPAAFDLGQDLKVALLSVTEGEDKPIKYPVLFHDADIILITKTDLIPHLDWSEEESLKYIKQVNPKAQVIQLSARSGQGMEQWYELLQSYSSRPAYEQ